MGMSVSKLLELVMDRETWRAVINGIAKSQTRLSDWTELIDGFHGIIQDGIFFLFSFQTADRKLKSPYDK